MFYLSGKEVVEHYKLKKFVNLGGVLMTNYFSFGKGKENSNSVEITEKEFEDLLKLFPNNLKNNTMLVSELKTIDFQILEWFDKTYGNTYFASRITLNFGLENQTEFIIPFTYGHGNHAEFKSYEKIDEYFNLNKGSIGWRYCNDNNIIVRTNKRDALKRELKNI